MKQPLPLLGGAPAKRGRGAPEGGAVQPPSALRATSPRGGRAKVFAALAVLVAAPLAGCAGFEPLYAMPDVAPALSSVDVVAPQGRAGYLMRQQLNDELAHDFSAPARYRLELTLAESRIPRGLRISNVAAEIELDLHVGYRLVETATAKELLRGEAPVSVFYAATDAPYAGIAAQQDAQERAASQAAVQIRLDLSRRFAAASRPASR